MGNYQNDTHEGVIFVYNWWFLLKENVGYWPSKLDILFAGHPEVSCRAAFTSRAYEKYKEIQTTS